MKCLFFCCYFLIIQKIRLKRHTIVNDISKQNEKEIVLVTLKSKDSRYILRKS